MLEFIESQIPDACQRLTSEILAWMLVADSIYTVSYLAIFAAFVCVLISVRRFNRDHAITLPAKVRFAAMGTAGVFVFCGPYHLMQSLGRYAYPELTPYFIGFGAAGAVFSAGAAYFIASNWRALRAVYTERVEQAWVVSVADHLRAGTFRWRLDGGAIEWDDRSREIFGFAPSYDAWKAAVDGETELARAQEAAAHAVRHGSVYVDVVRYEVSGASRQVLSIGTVAHGEMIGYNIDVTGQKIVLVPQPTSVTTESEYRRILATIRRGGDRTDNLVNG